MLITPMRPNTIARPSAMRSKIEASEAPWKAVSTVVVKRLQRRLDRRDGSDLGLVSELHGRAQADGWIRIGELRLRLVGVEERLDHEPQPTVGRHLRQVRQRYGAEWLPVVRAGDIDHIPVAARSLRAADDQLGRARARARVDAT